MALGSRIVLKPKSEMIALKLPFSKTVLASIIGVRRETLSRKLSEMKKRNIIEIENNTYIFDRM